MATWHQINRPGGIGPLWHEHDWTVVSDPPNQTLCTILFTTEMKALQYIENLRKLGKDRHCYVLPPAPGGQT